MTFRNDKNQITVNKHMDSVTGVYLYKRQPIFGIIFLPLLCGTCIVFVYLIVNYLQIPVAARSNAWVCGHSFDGIVGSNTARSLMFVYCIGCVVSGFCDEPIPVLKQSYRMCVCVCVCVSGAIRCNSNFYPVNGQVERGQTNREINYFCGFC